MRIGILTFHRSVNYGAFVQAYALRTLVKQLRCDDEVEIIDYDTIFSRKYYLKRYLECRSFSDLIYTFKLRKTFLQSLSKQKLSKKHLFSNNLFKFSKFVSTNYDVIIVGSDEVWNVRGIRKFPNAFWLPNIDNAIKISYAVSSRNCIGDLSKDEVLRAEEYLDSFSFISVRDNVSLRFVNSLINNKKIPLSLMCDPTMAYDFTFDSDNAKQLLKTKFGVDPSLPILAVMDECGLISSYVAEKYKNKIQIISLFKRVKGVHNNSTINPFEWVQVIGAVDGLLTSFFHGMCIAINANTPFHVFEYRNIKDDNYSKSYDLLVRYGFENCYSRVENADERKQTIDDFVERIISKKMVVDYSTIKTKEQKMFTTFIEYLKRIDCDN